MIQLINPGTSSGGGGGGAVTETLTPGTTQAAFEAVGEGTHNIAAGKYRVVIYNAGVFDITVNGITVPPGERWVIGSHENRITARFDLTPAVTIVVPALGAASYYTETPSS